MMPGLTGRICCAGRQAFHGVRMRTDGWIANFDPGAHRRIKGLRLVTAYALAAMGGSIVSPGSLMAPLAGGFALWASVSEGEGSRWRSSRDLVLLVLAATFAAVSMVLVDQLCSRTTTPPELLLVVGTFLVGYMRKFGRLGTGVGSQIFIGMAMAFGFSLGVTAMPMMLMADGGRHPCS